MIIYTLVRRIVDTLVRISSYDFNSSSYDYIYSSSYDFNSGEKN